MDSIICGYCNIKPPLMLSPALVLPLPHSPPPVVGPTNLVPLDTQPPRSDLVYIKATAVVGTQLGGSHVELLEWGECSKLMVNILIKLISWLLVILLTTLMSYFSSRILSHFFSHSVSPFLALCRSPLAFCSCILSISSFAFCQSPLTLQSAAHVLVIAGRFFVLDSELWSLRSVSILN